MSGARWLALAVVTVLLIGIVGVSVGSRVRQERQMSAEAPGQPRLSLSEVLAGPHIVFRSTSQDSTYGRVAAVPVHAPDGPRAVTDVECERVFSVGEAILCLHADRGLLTTFRTQVLDEDFGLEADLPLTGLPSRARLSADGRLAATTTFVTGHSYAGGDFSTATVVRHLDGAAPWELAEDGVDVPVTPPSTASGTGRLEVAGTGVNVEDFELRIDGEVVTAPDVNVWGVTFAADGETFYATAATQGTTWLVEGSLTERTLTSVAADAECPSLSPDGTRVVYKKREGAVEGLWRLAVRDLDSGAERLLAERRSVDDQVEWLDDGRILYGMPREGAEAAISDVWVLDLDAGSPAEILLPEAWSPAVVR